MKTKTIVLLLLGCTFFGVGLVSVLFLMSEEKMQRNNAFQRRYVPHPITQSGSFDLNFNSYYFAGVDGAEIYLGNTTAPLNLSILDTSLKSINRIRVSIDQMELPYKHVRIQVKPPFFYVVDGNVPIIFKGDVSDWNANTLIQDEAYFSQWVVTDSTNFAIRTINSQTNEHMIGVLMANESSSLYLSEDFLEKQLDGIFDTDGLLLWNDELSSLIYIYYYRNQFKVSDANLKNIFTGKTIDTISIAQIDFTYNHSRDQTKIDRQSTKINNYSTTAGNHLFVHSTRLGSHEPEEMLKKASIIDVYDLKNSTYKFSFYLFHYKGKKMKSFEVQGDLLVAIMEDVLLTYNLNPKYFNRIGD